MATLKTTIKLLSYTDDTSSNAPKEVLHDLEKEFIDETITETDSKLVSLPASSVDETILFDITNIKYLFIQNRSQSLQVNFKLNGIGNTEYSLGPDGMLFFKSAQGSGLGEITSLHVSNPDTTTAVTLRIFAAK